MSPTPPNSDPSFMRHALDLAKDVRDHVWPNPPVGCVIVQDGVILAQAAPIPTAAPCRSQSAGYGGR